MLKFKRSTIEQIKSTTRTAPTVDRFRDGLHFHHVVQQKQRHKGSIDRAIVTVERRYVASHSITAFCNVNPSYKREEAC